jgi:sulfatase modifying factor 1
MSGGLDLRPLAVTALLAGLAACDAGERATPPAAEASSPPAEASLAAGTTGAAVPAVASGAPAAEAAPAASGPPEGMVEIPEGVFKMGGSGLENSPAHDVAIARFYLDKTEVTMDAYAGCVKAGACQPPKEDNPFCNVRFPDRGAHPANCVDWRDAEAFCKHVGKRLPSEREWEYAARAGAQQRMYAWGNEEPDTTRSCYMHQGGSCPVASYPAGGFGLFDMTGNVWEWTSSWFAPYPHEPADGQFKVYRGGSWSRRFAKWMRNDLRNRYAVHEQSASVGIRCAKDHPLLSCPAGSVAASGRCALPTDPAPPPIASAARPLGSGPLPPGAFSGAPGSAKPALDDAPPKRVRASGFDADCQKHYPGLPVAYQWVGGNWGAREPLISGAGCKKRDIGVGWSSACCPN